jgi:hypothetical protein
MGIGLAKVRKRSKIQGRNRDAAKNHCNRQAHNDLTSQGFQLSKEMSEQEKAQIEKWQDDCQHIDDLVKSCPALTDGELLHDWYQEVHGWLIHLGNEVALAKSAYLQKCFTQMESGINADAWDRIKRSSTLTENYLSGKNPELYSIWQRLHNLNRNLETILSDMRTLLVGIREADRRDNMTAQNQRQQPQTSRAANPAVTDQYGWPKG